MAVHQSGKNGRNQKVRLTFNVAYFGYSQSQQAVDENGAEQVEANVEVGVNFTEVEEQVTAKDEVNLRSTMEQGVMIIS